MVSVFNSAGYDSVVLLYSGLLMLIVDRRYYKAGKAKKEHRYSIVLGTLLIVLSMFAIWGYFTIFRT